MKQLLMPILLVFVAIGLFVVYINPMYQQNIKPLRERIVAYDEALTKAQELRTLRDSLLSKRNAFNTADVQKLAQVLPDNVDNIRFVIDINNVAARRGLSLTNVELGELSRSRSSGRSDMAVGPTGDPIGSVTIGFSVAATYDDLLGFLQDLEHSLRIIDVEKISFEGQQNGRYNVDFSIKTYWLH